MKLTAKSTLLMSALFAAATLTACGPQTRLPAQMSQPVRVQSQNTQARQLLVRFKGQMNRARAAEFNAKYGVMIRQFLPKLNVYVVEIDANLGLKADKVMAFLQHDPMVAHAEVNLQLQVSPIHADMQTMPVME